jgi:magnesium chelatase family protein
VQHYRKKISGPFLDLIDLHVDVKPLSVEEKFAEKSDATTTTLREKVCATREIHRLRFGDNSIPYNAAIPTGQIMKWCEFRPSALDCYKKLIAQGSYSMRATDRMARIARTIADLDQNRQNHLRPSRDEERQDVLTLRMR